MPSAMHQHLDEKNAFSSGESRGFYGTALFVDVRRSSQIVQHIERHNGLDGPGLAAELFMQYLAGCMAAITDKTDAKCQPSGDAVLAVFEGRNRLSEAIESATAAIRFVEDTFEPRNGELLSCNGNCRSRHGHGKGRRHGCDTKRFQVGVGIDVGYITESSLSSNYGASQELVGSCVSLAAKLSGWARSSNAIALRRRTYRNARHNRQLTLYRWRRHRMKVGGRKMKIIVTHPPNQ
jgi:class 3 adenylate cyclase